MPRYGGPEIEIAGGEMLKENVVWVVIFPDVPVMLTTVLPTRAEVLVERVR